MTKKNTHRGYKRGAGRGWGQKLEMIFVKVELFISNHPLSMYLYMCIIPVRKKKQNAFANVVKTFFSLTASFV